MAILKRSDTGKVKSGFYSGIGIAFAAIVVGIVWTKYIAPQLARVAPGVVG